MDLVTRIDLMLERQEMIPDDELDSLLSHLSFKDIKEEIIRIIHEHLNYPNLNALLLAHKIPDKRYEPKLLSYEPEDMTDDQAIYWMFTLGKIKSEEGFEIIKKFTEGILFHQAYLAMTTIDAQKAITLFEGFLDVHSVRYDRNNKRSRHGSGFNTLIEIFDVYPGKPEDLVRNYDLRDNKKKELVLDAIEYFKENIH